MAIELYLMRHGASNREILEEERGLLPHGQDQAAKLASLNPEVVYASWLLRAEQTAKLAANGKDIRSEQAFGRLPSKQYGRDSLQTGPSVRHLVKPDAEYIHFKLIEIAQEAEHAGLRRVLIISHEPHIKAVLKAHFEGQFPQGVPGIPYCQGVKLIYTRGKLKFGGVFSPDG